MSIRIMSAVWELELPPSEKLVLLSLADWSNDDGWCHPSIATVAHKTGVSERTVQRVLREAESAGHLTRQEIIGKGCKYRLHPRHSVTPDKASPVTNDAETPDTVSPNTSVTVISSEANASSPRPWVLPVGVSLQTWQDFLSNRKRKRLGNTPSTWKAFNDDLVRISAQTGIPPPKLIEHAAAKGWGGIYDPNERSRSNERPDNPLAIAVNRLNAHR